MNTKKKHRYYRVTFEPNEDLDGAMCETEESVVNRVCRLFGFTNEQHIKILEKGTEKLGEFDGTEYYIASPVTFALYGQVYFTLGNSLIYMPELENVYFGGEQ